jgi:RNA polymerase sigma-70 factor (sigma-E family)
VSTFVQQRETVAESGFEALYTERYTALVRLAYLMLGSVHDAEEVVQEAFAELHRRWGMIQAPAGYVRTSVVNGCRHRQRRAAMARQREQRSLPPDTATSGPPGDPLADAIARLPERQRAVIVLRYFEDMSEAEIAEAIGCRRGTVKSLASRALAELRRVVDR